MGLTDIYKVTLIFRRMYCNVKFIDRLEVNNNTIVKNTTYLAHTHYIYMHTVMLRCINVQIYIKKNGDNPNTYVHLRCVKNITPPGPYFTK